MQFSINELTIIDDAIYAIYANSNERKMRRLVLEELRKLIPFDYGDFSYTQLDDQQHYVEVDPITVTKYSKEFIDQYNKAYDEKYGRQDYTSWCLYSDDSTVYRDSDLISQNVREKLRYYNEFLKPRGLLYGMGCFIKQNKRSPVSITIYRDDVLGDFTDHEVKILEILVRHLENRFNMDNQKPQKPQDQLITADSTILEMRKKYGLTWRELEIIVLILDGCSNREIAEVLGIAVTTVKKHVSNILNKTATDSRGKLISIVRKT